MITDAERYRWIKKHCAVQWLVEIPDEGNTMWEIENLRLPSGPFETFEDAVDEAIRVGLKKRLR